MKIAITGYSGSGKSTLAEKLAAGYRVPVLHLDTVHWLPGWQEREGQEELALVRDFLDSNGGWVIDGNYSKLEMERRLREADLIVQMLFNRFACYIRARKRFARYRGKSRPDMTAGCDEKLDWEFTKWIFHGGRTKAAARRYKSVREQYPDKVVVIRNQRQLDAFVRKMTEKE